MPPSEQRQKQDEALRQARPAGVGSPVGSLKGSGTDGQPPTGGDRPGFAGWKTVAAGVAVVIGVAAGTWFFQSLADPTPSSQEIAQRQATFAAAGPVQMQMVPAADIATAAQGMAGPDWTTDRKQALQTEAEAGRVSLVYMTLWDSQVEDGDIVDVVSPGYPPVTVHLKNARTTVALPAPSSGKLTVMGDFDGGGGITLGVLSGGNPVDLPYLQPRERVDIPVRPSP